MSSPAPAPHLQPPRPRPPSPATARSPTCAGSATARRSISSGGGRGTAAWRCSNDATTAAPRPRRPRPTGAPSAPGRRLRSALAAPAWSPHVTAVSRLRRPPSAAARSWRRDGRRSPRRGRRLRLDSCIGRRPAVRRSRLATALAFAAARSAVTRARCAAPAASCLQRTRQRPRRRPLRRAIRRWVRPRPAACRAASSGWSSSMADTNVPGVAGHAPSLQPVPRAHPSRGLTVRSQRSRPWAANSVLAGRPASDALARDCARGALSARGALRLERRARLSSVGGELATAREPRPRFKSGQEVVPGDGKPAGELGFRQAAAFVRDSSRSRQRQLRWCGQRR